MGCGVRASKGGTLALEIQVNTAMKPIMFINWNERNTNIVERERNICEGPINWGGGYST